MPSARNPIDHQDIYYEVDGIGPPVLVMGGFASSTSTVRRWPVALGLAADHLMIYVDQRGHGRSAKPHDRAAYAMRTRVADIVSVLDDLGFESAHFVAASYGAKLAFAVAAYAQQRVRSLTAYGMAPYGVDPEGPVVSAVSRAMASADGMEAFVQEMSALLSVEGPVRAAMLRNDHAALAASWAANQAEADLSARLTQWELPCLLYAGTEDDDFYTTARLAASVIPGAQFEELQGKTHFSGYADNSMVPRIRAFIATAEP